MRLKWESFGFLTITHATQNKTIKKQNKTKQNKTKTKKMQNKCVHDLHTSCDILHVYLHSQKAIDAGDKRT